MSVYRGGFSGKKPIAACNLSGCATMPSSEEAIVEVSPHGSSTISGAVWNTSRGYFEHHTTVTLVSESGQTFELVTDDRGRFRFDGLGAGTYTLRVGQARYYPGIEQPLFLHSEEISLGGSQGVHLDVEVVALGCGYTLRPPGSLFDHPGTDPYFRLPPIILR